MNIPSICSMRACRDVVYCRTLCRRHYIKCDPARHARFVAMQARYYQRHKAMRNAYQQGWRERNRERVNERQRGYDAKRRAAA